MQQQSSAARIIEDIRSPKGGGEGEVDSVRTYKKELERKCRRHFLTRLHRAREKSRSDSHVGLPRAYCTEFPLQGKGGRVSATQGKKGRVSATGKGGQGFCHRERKAWFFFGGREGATTHF
jgi:hypothetical protein